MDEEGAFLLGPNGRRERRERNVGGLLEAYAGAGDAATEADREEE